MCTMLVCEEIHLHVSQLLMLTVGVLQDTHGVAGAVLLAILSLATLTQATSVSVFFSAVMLGAKK